jgi:hypothetical protein
MFPLLLPIFISRSLIKRKVSWGQIAELIRIVDKAHADPIDKLPCNTDNQKSTLLQQLWKLPSAKHYTKNDVLEYQTREGYCARATERFILKSFDRFPSHLVPEQKSGESNPDKWRAGLEELAKQEHLAIPNIHINVVRGDVPFEKFLTTLINDENTRVAVNYLRPALFGFARPKWIPAHFVMGLFAGHFSPIVGILKNENDPKDPLVAVFDVNHKYGGTYLVPASRLHQSVKALDVSTRQSRALIVLGMP